MNRWTVGILLAFAAVFVANGLLAWYAIQTDDPIEVSYGAEPR